jgi:hypothetical protein
MSVCSPGRRNDDSYEAVGRESSVRAQPTTRESLFPSLSPTMILTDDIRSIRALSIHASLTGEMVWKGSRHPSSDAVQ